MEPKKFICKDCGKDISDGVIIDNKVYCCSQKCKPRIRKDEE